MDSHSHNSNIYPVPVTSNKDNEIFGGYMRNPCAQQPEQKTQFFSAYAVPMSNNITQPFYNQQYNIMYQQSVYRNQNTYPNFSDWSDSCMKNGYKEKKKECCIENDVYKSKNIYSYNKNIIDAQWYYNCDNQKYSELPSCSQINIDSTMNSCNIKDKNVKSVKYCSIQKFPENEKFYYSKQSDNTYLNQYKLAKDYPSCSQLSQTCNLYSGSTCLEIDKKILSDHSEVPNVCDIQNVCDMVTSNQYYQSQTYVDVLKIHEKQDESGNGGESDIVVEDSDEESTESEEIYKIGCAVCNINVNNHFYDISNDNTVTSFSQTKVSEKLFSIFGWLKTTSKNLCSICMSLLNTLDNLEIQLDTVKQELLDKYKNSTKRFVEKQGITVEKNKLKNKKCKRKLLGFKCRVCKKIFNLENFYKYHMSKHKKKYFHCTMCDCKFKTNLLFNEHLKIHEKCLKCKKPLNVNHVCDIKKFICHICGKIFKTNANLKEHENYCSGDLPYSCKICEKKFASTSKLNQHTKLFHEKNYTDFCKICNKGFIKKSDYISHMLKHSDEKKFLCKICGKVYKTLSNLNQHKKVHNDNLPFSCTVCKKGFLRKENLESHLNIHNGIKPFPCVVCEKKFVSQKNLDAHLKVHNGTVKKTACKICGKKISHGIKEHMRTHSDFKEFSCHECNMKFLTKGALAKHVKRKHENKELDVLQI